MRSQDHFNDLLVSGQKNTLGGLCYNGSCNMMDVYPLNGDHNFLGWNLFGDASLQLRTAEPESIQINISNQIPSAATSLLVQTGRPAVRVCLSRFDDIIASGFTDNAGSVTLNWSIPTQTGYTYLLTATGFNCLPFSQDLQCFAEGEGYLNITDITYEDNEDGLINPEEVISLQITVNNPSLVDVADAYIWFNNLSDYLDFSFGLLHLGNIAAGTDKHVQNYLRISRNCPDFRNLEYELVLSSNGQSWVTPGMITVHSPVITIVDCKLLPEKNWLNPGDEIQVQYKIANTGSAAMKNTRCELSTDRDWIDISRPVQSNLSCPSNDSLLVTYTVRIDFDAEVDSLFDLAFEMIPANAPDRSWTDNRLVVNQGVMLEGFETNDNVRFPFVYPYGHPWLLSPEAIEGSLSMQTPDLNVGQYTSLEITLELSEPGELVFYLKTDLEYTACYLSFCVNESLCGHWHKNPEWQRASFTLNAGVNKLTWYYRNRPEGFGDHGHVHVDAIQFPPGAMFTDAQLLTDVSEINLTIHPDQVLYAPVNLTSADGRYIDYTAVLQKTAKDDKNRDNIRLVFNRDNLVPGTIDSYIATLYNPLPDRSIREVRISIPAGIVVTAASNFTMAGQPSLQRTGSIGNCDVITWINAEGSPADSLRCVLSVMSDAYVHNTVLNYEIITAEPWDFFYWDNGSVYLYTDGCESSFLTLTAHSGTLFEKQSDRLAVKCIQSLMPEPLPDYVLQIYNNGVNVHSIPVSVTYDPTPGFDTSITSLRAYPNPFRDNLTIDYYLPQDGKAEITLYNIRGQKVQSLYDAPAYAGKNQLSWNGKLSQNRILPTGVYLIKLHTSAGKDRLTRCLLVK
jgi:hypothetical protein